MSSLLHSRFRIVTQHSSPLLWGGALSDDTKNGCVADYSMGGFFIACVQSPLPTVLRGGGGGGGVCTQASSFTVA